MNKNAFLFVLLAMALPLAGCDACKENVFTKLGDTMATLGKSGMDKDTILAERAASRTAKCAEQKAGEAKQAMGF